MCDAPVYSGRNGLPGSVGPEGQRGRRGQMGYVGDMVCRFIAAGTIRIFQ